MSAAAWMTIVYCAVVVLCCYRFYSKREADKAADYFGEPRPLTTAEKAQLARYTSQYQPVAPDPRLPALPHDGWEFVDIAFSATEMVYEAPLPSADELHALQAGDLLQVKVIDQEGDVQRLWVEYHQADHPLLQGTLQNDPFDLPTLRAEQPIWFHPNHILLLAKNQS